MEILEYGLNQIILSILNVITIITLGLIFEYIYEAIIFIIAYTTLRSFAGGYHARTPLRCYCISVLLISIFFALMKMINNEVGVLLSVDAVSIGIIVKMAPMEADNKPLDEKEKFIYRRRTRKILLVEVCLIIMGYVLKSSAWVQGISMAIQISAILLLVSWIQKLCLKRKRGVSNA